MELIPKFRAWLPTLKWMCEVTVIDYDLRSVDICRIEDVARHTEMRVDKDEVVLMQSTGIKDKNGTEIFEGDVVRLLDSLYTVFYDSEKGSYRLKPHDDRWVTDYMSNFSHGGNFEVVGNIFEGKERGIYDYYQYKS